MRLGLVLRIDLARGATYRKGAISTNNQDHALKGVSKGRSAWGVILAKCLLCPVFQSTKAEC